MNLKHLISAVTLATLTVGSIAQACTGIRLIAEDGSPVFGRTQEFGDDILEFT